MVVSYQTMAPQQPINITKKKEVSGFGGSAAALVGSGLIAGTVPQVITPSILNGMKKVGKLDAETQETLHNAIKKMVVDNGLDKKGVRIRFIGQKNNNPLDFNKFFSRTPQKDNLLRNIVETLTTDPVRRGENAFFVNKELKLPKISGDEFNRIMENEGLGAALKALKKDTAVFIKKNSIILPKEGIAPAGFHEVGHAMNYNLSKFGKLLQNFRPLTKLAPIIGIFAACTRKAEAKDGKELTSGQKTKNFIRDNAGVLAFASYLPMLIEEGMATYKGQKYANKVLSKDLAKTVLKGNSIAYMSYLTVAVTAGLAAHCAVKIKDKIISNKQKKQDAIENAKQAAIDAYNTQFNYNIQTQTI